MEIFGREKLVQEIKETIGASINQKYLFQLYGEPGVGKTSIVKNVILEKTKGQGDLSSFLAVSIDLRKCGYDSIDILNALHNELESHIYFYRYEYAINELLGIKLKKEEGASKIVDTILSKVPILKDVYPLVKLSLNALKDYWEKQGKEHVALREKLESAVPPYTNILTECFVEDLNDYTAANDVSGIIIILENFDDNKIIRYIGSNADWIEKHLIGKTKGVFWIVTCNKEVSFKVKEFTTIHRCVERFADDDKCVYRNNSLHPIMAMGIDKYNINDENVLKKVRDLCNGLPGLADVIFKYIHDNEGVNVDDLEMDLKDPQKPTYDKFMERHYLCTFSSEQLQMIKYLSAFMSWDINIYNRINEKYNLVKTSNFFDTLTESAIVEEKDSAYDFKILAKSYFQNQITIDAREYKEAYSYYAEIVDDIIKKPSIEKLSRLIKYAPYATEIGCRSCVNANDFLTFSEWFKNTEQKYTKLGLFDQKANLILLYLKCVEECQLKRYDKKDGKNLYYYFTCLYDLAWAYKYMKNYEKSHEYFTKYFTELTQYFSMDEDKRIIQAIYLMGTNLYDLNKIDNSRHFLQWTIDVSKSQGNSEYHAYALNVLGSIHMQKDEFEDAANCFDESINKYSEEKHLVKVYKNYSTLYFRKVWRSRVSEDYEKFLDYYAKFKQSVLSSPTKTTDEIVAENMQICSDILSVVMDANIDENAIKTKLDKIKCHALELLQNIEKDHNEANVHVEKIMVANNIGVIYMAMGDFSKASEYMNKSLNIARGRYAESPNKRLLQMVERNSALIHKHFAESINRLNEYRLAF